MNAAVQPLPSPSQWRRALTDLGDGLRAHEIWRELARMDVRQRYRRSILGPFWITIAMVIWILAVGPLYSLLLGVGSAEFIPYLAMGIIAWSLVSSLLLEGAAAFVGAESLVRSVRLPFSVHILRVLQRNLVIFAHNLLAFVPFMVVLGIWPQWRWLAAIPGVALILLACFPLALLLGTLSARFRDLQQMIASVVQLAFFLTPVFWHPDLLGAHRYVADYNPFHLLLEVVRGPVVDGIPPAATYAKLLVIIAVLYLVAIPFFAHYRRRLAFWV